ncbi:MAG: hypothetical protein ABW026_14245 [Microvirga sp.]
MTQLDREYCPPQSSEESARVYPGDPRFLLQSLVTTLGNLDFAYDEERRTIGRSIADATVRSLVLERLKRRHWEKRDPYVRQLALLRERIRAAAPETLAG